LTHDACCGTARHPLWYAEHGHGDPCVLLHPGGAGVDSRALVPTLDALTQGPPRLHARAARTRSALDVDAPVSYQPMAHDTIMFIESVIGRPTYLTTLTDRLRAQE
jgi:hypothetical protein